jgi:hypothetical protein
MVVEVSTDVAEVNWTSVHEAADLVSRLPVRVLQCEIDFRTVVRQNVGRYKPAINSVAT